MEKQRKKRSKIKVLRANQILVQDLNGCPRILLDATDGEAGISITIFSKKEGQIQISINDQNHGVLAIMHPSGKTGACLGVKADGQSGLELRDNNGLPSLLLSSKGKNQKKPEIEIQTQDGKKQLI